MLSAIDVLSCRILQCNFRLDEAEDSKNIDSFNYWMAERCRLQRERANLLAASIVGGQNG